MVSLFSICTVQPGGQGSYHWQSSRNIACTPVTCNGIRSRLKCEFWECLPEEDHVPAPHSWDPSGARAESRAQAEHKTSVSNTLGCYACLARLSIIVHCFLDHVDIFVETCETPTVLKWDTFRFWENRKNWSNPILKHHNDLISPLHPPRFPRAGICHHKAVHSLRVLNKRSVDFTDISQSDISQMVCDWVKQRLVYLKPVTEVHHSQETRWLSGIELKP